MFEKVNMYVKSKELILESNVGINIEHMFLKCIECWLVSAMTF
jgi:hypothetical protein